MTKGGLLRRAAGSILLAILVVGALWISPVWRGPETGRIRLAVQTGIFDEPARLLVVRLRERRPDLALEATSRLMEVLQVRDCCAATAPWALSGGSLEAAVLCPDAAAELLRNNDEFISLGPAVVNGDVFVERRDATGGAGRALRVGIAHGRTHQATMVRERYGEAAQVLPMPPQALAYALHEGKVDSAVMDAALAEKAEATILPWDGADIVTHVLVVRRGFAASPDFQDFLRAYEEARREASGRVTALGAKLPPLGQFYFEIAHETMCRQTSE